MLTALGHICDVPGCWNRSKTYTRDRESTLCDEHREFIELDPRSLASLQSSDLRPKPYSRDWLEDKSLPG